MNREIMIKAGFLEQLNLVDAGSCPMCKKKISLDSFVDNLSRKEFSISGLCQECQDGIFG